MNQHYRALIGFLLICTFSAPAIGQIDGDPVAGTWYYDSNNKVVVTIHGDIYKQDPGDHVGGVWNWEYLGNLGLDEISLLASGGGSGATQGYVLTVQGDIYWARIPEGLAEYFASVPAGAEVSSMAYGPNYQLHIVNNDGAVYLHTHVWEYRGNIYGDAVALNESSWSEVKDSY